MPTSDADAASPLRIFLVAGARGESERRKVRPTGVEEQQFSITLLIVSRYLLLLAPS
jgi:hypothetical protein